MAELRIQVLDVLTVWGEAQHLVIERIDGKPICRDWDWLQRIKNECLGEDVLAVEVFPPSDMVVDEVNRRHLWTLPKRALTGIGLGNVRFQDG